MTKRLLLLAWAVCIFGSAWAEGQFKIIALHYRLVQDILPAVQPLVGEGGMASAVENNLVVRASPERMAAIERVIALLDVERRTLHVSVSRDRSSQRVVRDAGVRGTVRRGDIEVRIPDRRGSISPGMTVDFGQYESSAGERVGEHISVLEGARAIISVGQSVPFTETWAVLTRRYVRTQEAVQFRDISTGFSVRPRLIGDEVELEIAPYAASFDGGGIEFQTLSTTVRVRPGEWFDLGGSMRSRDEVSREIFSGLSGSSGQNLQLWIRVE